MEHSVGFQPHLYRPHCGGHQMAEVTGYARYGLNIRGKFCKHCEKEFQVCIYIETSAVGEEFTDGKDKMQQERLKRVRKMVKDARSIRECAELVGTLASMMLREKR